MLGDLNLVIAVASPSTHLGAAGTAMATMMLLVLIQTSLTVRAFLISSPIPTSTTMLRDQATREFPL